MTYNHKIRIAASLYATMTRLFSHNIKQNHQNKNTKALAEELLCMT